jgi:nitroreductase
MEFGEVVRRRRMVRAYTDEPVDASMIERLLTHARHAPSAGFSQGWAFLLLDRPEMLERFWAATTPEEEMLGPWMQGMRSAPVIIVPLSCKKAYLDRYAEPDKGWTDRDESRWPAPYWDIDTGMASLLILLDAVDQGLGACFFGIPPDRIERFRSEFGVPADHHPIGAISIGHPAPDRRSPSLRRGRRGADDVVHRGQW